MQIGTGNKIGNTNYVTGIALVSRGIEFMGQKTWYTYNNRATWTPAIAPGTTANNLGNNNCSYTNINGELVSLSIEFTFVTTATGAGLTFTFTGLPFTSMNIAGTYQSTANLLTTSDNFNKPGYVIINPNSNSFTVTVMPNIIAGATITVGSQIFYRVKI